MVAVAKILQVLLTSAFGLPLPLSSDCALLSAALSPPGRSTLLAAAEQNSFPRSKPPAPDSEAGKLRADFISSAFESQLTNRLFHAMQADKSVLGFLVSGQAEKAYAAAKKWAETNGVEVQEIKLGNGEKGLRIVPKKTGSPLNLFAEEVQRRFGTELVYSPEKLFVSGGGFIPETNRILLSHDAIRDLAAGPTEIHERLHAHFHYAMLQGELSPFHIEFMADQGSGKKITSGPNYETYLSSEELATYPLNLSIAISRMRMLRKSGKSFDSPEFKEELKSAKVMSSAGVRIAQASDRLTRGALAEMKANPDSVSLGKVEKTGAEGKKIVFYALKVERDGFEVEIPCITLAEAKALEAQVNARVASGEILKAEAGKTLMAEIRKRGEEKLEQLSQITKAAAENFGTIDGLLGKPLTEVDFQEATSKTLLLNLRINRLVPRLAPARDK